MTTQDSIVEIDGEEFTLAELDEWIDESKLIPSEENGFVRVNLPDELAEMFRDARLRESPSKVLRFLECPMRWWSEYYAPAEITEEEVRPWNIAGTILHRIYEVFYSEPAHLRTEVLFDDLVDRAREVLRTKDYEDGLMDEESIDGYTAIMEGDNGFFKKVMRELLDTVDNLYEFDDDPREVRIVANEMYMSHYVEGVRIGCKTDRTILSNDTGGEIIDDYKWGKHPEEGAEADVLTHRYLQLGIYAWARYRTTERSEVVPIIPEAVRMLFVKPIKGQLKRVRINILPEDIAAVDRLLTRVILLMKDMQENGYFYAKPQSNARDQPCSYCPLVDLCPARKPNKFNAETLLENYRAAMEAERQALEAASTEIERASAA